jgi:hypothetical protein
MAKKATVTKTRQKQTRRGGKKGGNHKHLLAALLPMLRPLSITVNGGTPMSAPFTADPITVPLMGGTSTLVFKVLVRFSSTTLSFQAVLLDEADVKDIPGTTTDTGTTRNYSFTLTTAPKNYMLQAAIFTTSNPDDVKMSFTLGISTS